MASFLSLPFELQSQIMDILIDDFIDTACQNVTTRNNYMFYENLCRQITCIPYHIELRRSDTNDAHPQLGLPNFYNLLPKMQQDELIRICMHKLDVLWATPLGGYGQSKGAFNQSFHISRLLLLMGCTSTDLYNIELTWGTQYKVDLSAKWPDSCRKELCTEHIELYHKKLCTNHRRQQKDIISGA